MNKWVLRFFGFVAYGLLGMGMICNMTFYSGFGTGFSSVTYTMVGLWLDLGKVASILALVYFIRRDLDRYFVQASVCAVFLFLLSVLSLGAGYGFLSEINEALEAKRLKESAIYEMHLNAVQEARAQLDNLAQYATVDEASLTAQIAPKPPIKRCSINRPKTVMDRVRAKPSGKSPITALNKTGILVLCGVANNNALIQQLQAQLMGHQRYQAAKAHYQSAQQAFNELTVTGVANRPHSLFVNLGQMTDNKPESVKGIFLLLSSLMVELLASVLLYLRDTIISDLLTPLTPVKTVTEQDRKLSRLTPTETDIKPVLLPPVDQATEELLERVYNDIATGELTRLSFRTLL